MRGGELGGPERLDQPVDVVERLLQLEGVLGLVRGDDVAGLERRRRSGSSWTTRSTNDVPKTVAGRIRATTLAGMLSRSASVELQLDAYAAVVAAAMLGDPADDHAGDLDVGPGAQRAAGVAELGGDLGVAADGARRRSQVAASRSAKASSDDHAPAGEVLPA